MINNFLEFLKITDGIAASDIIGWFFAFIGGVVVFKIIDSMQTSMERHSLIKEVEDSFNNLLSSPLAKSKKGKNFECFNTRYMLDNSKWIPFEKNKTDIIPSDAQRYVNIRKNDYMSTQMLHESLIYFRRTEKLYKDNILKPIDLADLWRELLPFSTNGRLEFYQSYFGNNDIECIVFVLLHTVMACNKYKMTDALCCFKSYYQENVQVQSYYRYNSRYRLRDLFNLWRFKRIMNR